MWNDDGQCRLNNTDVYYSNNYSFSFYFEYYLNTHAIHEIIVIIMYCSYVRVHY